MDHVRSLRFRLPLWPPILILFLLSFSLCLLVLFLTKISFHRSHFVHFFVWSLHPVYSASIWSWWQTLCFFCLHNVLGFSPQPLWVGCKKGIISAVWPFLILFSFFWPVCSRFESCNFTFSLISGWFSSFVHFLLFAPAGSYSLPHLVLSHSSLYLILFNPFNLVMRAFG